MPSEKRRKRRADQAARVFPEVTVTSYYSPTTRYQSLEGNCLHNDGLPSLAYGGHSCSMKWKIEAIEDEIWGIEGWEPARVALERGIRVTRCIGYDYGCADSRRFAKVDAQEKRALADGTFLHWRNRYPLREWQISRDELADVYARHPEFGDLMEQHTGSREVRKSSCFFCPAMKVEEVESMARDYPELALRAAVMEYRAETGKHGLQTCNGLGLGRGVKHTWDIAKGSKNWSWHRHLVAVGLLPENWLEIAKERELVPATWDEYMIEAKTHRETCEAAIALEVEAASNLPEIYRDVVEAKNVREPAKRKVEDAVRGTPAGDSYIAARVETKRVKKLKRELVAPDWANVAKSKPTAVEKNARRIAKRRFREAVAKAQQMLCGK
jgi:hypothetical protein